LSSPLSIDVAAVDVGYFSTKYTHVPAADPRAEVLAESIPSFCPRVVGSVSHGVGTDTLAGVVINVGEMRYFVGQDAALRSSGKDARVVSTDYADSDQYMALFRGALHYICRSARGRSALAGQPDFAEARVKRMMVGLPLNTWSSKKDSLRESLEAVHELPPMPWSQQPMKVDVRSVTVLAQPQGAFLRHSRNKRELLDLNTLVIDVGGGTTDWLLMQGRKVFYERSGAYPKATLACAFAVCDQIDPTLRDDPEIVKRVDNALRTSASTVFIAGESMPMAPYLPEVQKTLEECIARMVDSIGNLSSVDYIFVTGGGAGLLHSLLIQKFPGRAKTIHLDADPVFSNVLGFHRLGEMLNHAPV
jgi:plasmid segregation protein ParM